MNLWKKVLTGAATGVAALTIAMGLGAMTGQAASGPVSPSSVSAIKYDKADQKLDITLKSGTTDTEVLFGTPKITIKTSGTTIKEPTAWNVVSGPSVSISLAHLNSTKDNYIMLRTRSMDKPIVLKFAATQKLAAKYAGYETEALKKLVFSVKKTALTSAQVEDSKFMYRSAYGNEYKEAFKDGDWVVPFDDFAWESATLYFRTAAQTADGYEKDGAGILAETKTTLKDSKSEEAYYQYDAGTLPGADVKVKIPKTGNGPKITVDYSARKFTLKSGLSYRYLLSDRNDDGTYAEGTWSEWTASGSESKNVIALPQKDGKYVAGVFEVVTPVDAAKKKVQSKPTQLEFAKVPVLPMVMECTRNAWSKKINALDSYVNNGEGWVRSTTYTLLEGEHYKFGGDAAQNIPSTFGEKETVTVRAGEDVFAELYAKAGELGLDKSQIDTLIDQMKEKGWKNFDESASESASGSAVTVEGMTFSYNKNAAEKKVTYSIKNTSAQAYEYLLTDTATLTGDDPVKKGTAIKAKTTKDVEVKINYTKGNNKYLWIRTAADTKNKVWASEYACIGKIVMANGVQS